MTAEDRPTPVEDVEDVPDRSEVEGVVRRNIQALLEVRREQERKKSFQEALAGKITGFTGSMTFVFLHAALFGGWLVVNTGVTPFIEPFDPFPFVMLAMIASVEAIFLSTFVLISQNRMQALADKRADLDLQVNLLAEHEITRLIELVDGISRHLEVPRRTDPHLEELKKDVHPEVVLDEIERAQQDAVKD
ncbi:hypothetical protein BE08_12465 [Sorangium cellulosum]|uniref:DUF1003 domain-containing protein n=1 Tax=Sorangium cellulosum TaxID=56 RepID=A0A150PMF6_SORCE|nr:hypothetical protein BE08_12465 [Sorangium cellulosum]